MAYEPPPWPQVIAHRGDSAQAPENTRPAIESAIDIGVDMVEVDVRLTKDSVPILIHSGRLEDTTTGRGLVTDHTWEENNVSTPGSGRVPSSQTSGFCHSRGCST
jgi:glycerophosphoryl diester phosphodiesterase